MKRTSWLVIGVVALVTVTLVAQRTRMVSSAARGRANTVRPDGKTDLSGKPVAPNFTLKDMNDADVSLEQYRGKVVLVNFWATWCGPCLTEMPWLIEFQQKYADRGFTILGISMDDEGKKDVEPFLREERFDVGGQKLALNYPILLGNDELAGKYNVFGMPTSVLISRDGKKVRTYVGLINHDTMVREIEGLL
jgi:thiol-disulfide isomerase/thioredoxin